VNYGPLDSFIIYHICGITRKVFTFVDMLNGRHK